ncbi:amidohydrolase [Persicitalea jodogahamensis]|uniref:Amidohydrolase n=1 Tax=Persicitalea jodogahamensis TaxID=402147 RepID=A0A8J3DBQ6_9BACT|nr:amidohydrolase [Persicitalea jodogahamensis]GHB73494.1 amidohydrolase [Persicitalea jodogahamensis]
MRKPRIFKFLCLIIPIFLWQCQTKDRVDLILHNGVVYSVDSVFSTHEAFAVKDGKFVAIGSNDDIMNKYEADSVIDAGGQSVFPGLYDPHSHFMGLGGKLNSADLVATSSYAEIVERLKAFRSEHPDREWLIGRGWDQNDWDDKRFPDKSLLDEAFPDIPVYLTRIDGHAALVNSKALQLAGVNATSKAEGGLVQLKNGQPTGILVDNAQRLVGRVIPSATPDEKRQMLKAAEKACLALGLTTVSDAGLSRPDIEMIDEMHKSGSLKIRDYAMISVSPENLDYYLPKGPYQSDRLTVRSFKIYADGALGSRGACLLQPYADDASTGFLLTPAATMDGYFARIADSEFQANTHCIGDSANRLVLDLYGKYLKGPNDRRWRVEHAQIVSTADVPKFGKYSVIPSVQPTHATSDMYWADERLGPERIKTAYAFKDLMQENGYIPLGSDFPVEAVNPLFGFHSAVARTDDKNYPDGGFQMENSLSREEALRGITLWAAKANFEEKTRGSIEPGKFADFVILQKDIMKIPLTEIRAVKVVRTVLGGETLYR